MSTIAVVGATGPTGRLVVEQALQRAHAVVAYVRSPDALELRTGLTVVGGELGDTERFAEAIRGCEAVVSTLGTRSRKERQFMTTHLPMVTSAMERAGVRRLVLMSALGGGAMPLHVRGFARLIFWFLSRVIFIDRTESEAALATAKVVWSAVYPAFLTDADAIPDVQLAEVDDVVNSKNSRIPRANMATALLDLVDDPKPRRLMIAPRGCLTTRSK